MPPASPRRRHLLTGTAAALLVPAFPPLAFGPLPGVRPGRLRFRRILPLAWVKSLHAKLFIVTALVTSGITVAVALQIIRNSRKELEISTKQIALETSQAVEADIVARDPGFSDPRKIESVLESFAGEGRSIFQIDVFKAEGKDQVSFLVSSGEEAEIEWKPGISTYMTVGTPTAENVPLGEPATGQTRRSRPRQAERALEGRPLPARRVLMRGSQAPPQDSNDDRR